MAEVSLAKLPSFECYWTLLMSVLVQVMAWWHQATSHFLGQCWPRSLSPYDATSPQCVSIKWKSTFATCQQHNAGLANSIDKRYNRRLMDKFKRVSDIFSKTFIFGYYTILCISTLLIFDISQYQPYPPWWFHWHRCSPVTAPSPGKQT